MPALADPTLDLLRSLDEPGKFVVRDNVPIFKPHDLRIKTAAGTKWLRVAEDALSRIATNTAALEAESGVVLRMTAGHVDPKLAEKDQPPLIGYARNVRVGKFGPRGEACLLATLYFLPDLYERYSDFPYRSADYFPSREEIRGVALLKREPMLDMGMVTYETPAGECYRYALGADVPDPSTTTVQPTEAAPEGHDGWAAHMTHYAKSNPWIGYAQQCYEGSAPMAAGQTTPNATTPSAATPAADPSMPLPTAEAVRMQGEQAAVTYARLETENKALVERIVKLESERDLSRCEQMVTQLEAECYQLVREEEVAELMKCGDQAARDKYVARLRKNYQKAPVSYGGREIPVFAGHVEGGTDAGDPTAAPAGHDKVMAHMKRNPGTSYEDAEQAVK